MLVLDFAEAVEAVEDFGGGEAAAGEEVGGEGAGHGGYFVVGENLALEVEQSAVHLVEFVVFERAGRDGLVAQNGTEGGTGRR